MKIPSLKPLALSSVLATLVLFQLNLDGLAQMNIRNFADQSMVRDLLAQLKSAAAIFNAEQQHSPSGFHEFVTVSRKIPKGSPITLTLARTGSTEAPPCSITPKTIICSGGKPGTRFPGLAGNVIYRFNSGPGTFSYQVVK